MGLRLPNRAGVPDARDARTRPEPRGLDMPFAQVVCYGNPPRTRHNTTVSRLDQNRWAGLLDVTIDANSPVPISRQIFLHLRRAIVDQALPAGSAVPSSRELARRIGVSRTSIVSAYDELYAEGYIEGRRGSGTFVSNDLPPPLDAGSGMSSPGSPSTRRLSAAGIRYRDLSSGALTPPSMPFALGRCSVDARTADAWRRISLRHQRTIPGDALGYSDPFGRPSFRQVVSEYLKVFRAVQCQADQVMITSGAQQALDLSIKVLLDPGDAVWVEDPCYPATLRAVVAANLRPVPVPVDAEGLCVAAGLEREPAPRAIFLTPSHQYPTGAVIAYACKPRTDGTLIQGNATAVYLLEGGKKRPFPLAEVFLSYGYKWSAITSVSAAELTCYATGAVMTFKEGTLVKASGGATVYQIEAGKKRPFTSGTVFLSYGYSWTAVIETDSKYLQSYPTGLAMEPAGSETPDDIDTVVDETAS